MDNETRLISLAKGGDMQAFERAPQPHLNYITSQVGGQPFSVHAEGERVIMRGPNGREEVDLAPPPQPVQGPEWPASLCPDGSPDANAPDPDAPENLGTGMDQPAPLAPEEPKPENGGSR